ncbi:MAG: PfkB family carbohydrate kinase [Bacteroidia bacterium]|nr:PfkB family carbohydrate kinase [Bacteroidia bacterium]
MSLVVVGSVAFDAIETPYGKTDKIIGGAATFICFSASTFLRPIGLVSVVGGDYPQSALDMFREKGVDLVGLEIKPQEKSFFWSGKYNTDLNTRETLATELNVLATFQPKVPETHQNSDFLMLGNLTPDIQRSVIHQMKKRPKLIVMDTMNFWMDIALDSLLQTIREVDVLTINDEEARQLSGEYSLKKAARKILSMGPKYLIIKKGEHGALLFHENGLFYAPALPIEDVFDPTGAGDTFAGGFIGWLAKTGDLSFENFKRAVIYGSALASFCVEQFGTQRLETLTQPEVVQRAQEFANLVQFNL